MASSEQGLEAAVKRSQAGLVYGVSAYTLWGVFPLYFRALAHVPPLTVLCHRVIWSGVFLWALILVRREWGGLRPVLAGGGNLAMLAVASVLLALNWLIFIYAVATKQVLEASLGYFINPLLSVALGILFLRERLRPWQWVAVSFATLGILNQALRTSTLPWIPLSLALTFGLYGFVRKKADLNSLHSLLIETTVLLPLAAVYLWWAPHAGFSGVTWGFLSASGVITAIPLLLFGAAVVRLRLSTMGFLQYIGPTLQFVVATWLIGEELSRVRLMSFVLCWVGIGVYVADSIVSRKPQPVADEPE